MPGPPDRPRHAFLLPWALADSGGVNSVLENLIREFSGAGPLAPLLIESAHDSAMRVTEGTTILRMNFPAPFDRVHPWRALSSFCLHLPFLLVKLTRLCRDYHIQTLNPHFIGLEYFCFALLRRAGLFRGRLLLSLHGTDIRLAIQSRGQERLFFRLMFRWSDALIACSEGLRDETVTFFPELRNRVFAIQNGIDVDHFLRTSCPGFELPPPFASRQRIVNIAAFEYKKAHDLLLEAFALLRKSCRAASCEGPVLVIAGQSGELLNSTQELVQTLDLEGHVLLYKDLAHDEAGGLLRSADLFVLSSRWEKGRHGEGLAVVLLEAAAAEKPVVSTLSCGVSELIRDGETGWTVPTEDPAALAEALSQALANPQERARRARNLHELVRREFTWHKAHYRYLELDAEPRANDSHLRANALPEL